MCLDTLLYGWLESKRGLQLVDLFRVGTSGWSYPVSGEGSWNGVYYPPGKVDELQYYAQRFNTVEVNSTFYRPAAPGYVWNWVRKTPANFTDPPLCYYPRGEKGDDERDPSGTIRRLNMDNPGTVLHFNFFGLCRNLNWSDVKLKKL